MGEAVDISDWSESKILDEENLTLKIKSSKYPNIDNIHDVKKLIAETTNNVHVINKIIYMGGITNLLRNKNLSAYQLSVMVDRYDVCFEQLEFLYKESEDQSLLNYILYSFCGNPEKVSKILLSSKNISKRTVGDFIKSSRSKIIIQNLLLDDININATLFDLIVEDRSIIPDNSILNLCINASDPLTLESLFKYCSEKRLDLIKHIASNTNITEKIVDMLMKHHSTRYLEILNRNETAKRYLEKLNSKSIENTYITQHGVFDENDNQLYNFRNIPEEYQIERIKCSKNPGEDYNIWCLAAHVNLTDKAQDMIININSNKLSEALASNSSISVESLEKLAYNNSEIVRGMVHEHIKRTDKINNILINMDYATGFVNDIKKTLILAETTIDVKIQEKILVFHKNNQDVLCALAKNVSINESLQSRLGSFGLRVVKILAENIAISENIQHALTESSYEVSMTLASNESIKESTQEVLITKGLEVRKKLIHNPSVTMKILEKIADLDETQSLIEICNLKIDISKKIMNKLLNSSHEVRVKLSEGKLFLDNESLAFLAKDKSPIVRKNIARKVRVSDSGAELSLVYDEYINVRKELAKNRNISARIKEELLRDKEKQVQIEAVKHNVLSEYDIKNLIASNDKELLQALLGSIYPSDEEKTKIREIIDAIDKKMENISEPSKSKYDAQIITFQDKETNNWISETNDPKISCRAESRVKSINSLIGLLEMNKIHIINQYGNIHFDSLMKNALTAKETDETIEKLNIVKQIIEKEKEIENKTVETNHRSIEENSIENRNNNFKTLIKEYNLRVEENNARFLQKKTTKDFIMEDINSSSIRIASRQIVKMTLVAIPNKYKYSFFPKVLANMLIHGVLENVHSDNQRAESIKSKISQEMKIEAMSIVGGELVNIVKENIINLLEASKSNSPLVHSLSDGKKFNTAASIINNTGVNTEGVFHRKASE